MEATIKTTKLRVREQANTESAIIGYLNEGDEVEVLAQTDDWVSVELEDGVVGFVKSEYVSVNE